MPTTRPLGRAALTLVVALAAAPAGAQPIEFPPTPVGGTSTIDCVSVCIVQEGSTGGCSSSSNIGGTLTEVSVGTPFSVVDLRRGPAPSGGSSACQSGTADPVDLPVNLNPGQVLFFDLTFAPHVPGFHDGDVRISGNHQGNPVGGTIPLTGEAIGGNPTAPCVPGPQTLCLLGDRFRVKVDWATNQGTSGTGNVVPFQTTDSGLFWFFNQANWEVVVKTVDACVPPFDRFWVFLGGLTNVETVITVTDTQEGRVRTYTNPVNTPFRPIQDTNAFATCP